MRKQLLSLGIMLASCASLVAQPKVLADNTTDLADGVYDYSKCFWKEFMVHKLMTFKLSPGIWTKMLEKDGWGIKTTSNTASDIAEYAKKRGWGDLEEAESANNNDRENNKAHVSEMVDALKDKVGFTLQADGIKGSNAEWDLTHRYMITIAEFLATNDWKPKGGAAFITLVVSPTVKDVAVSAAPDGKHFTVTAPSDHETEEWDSKITKGLLRSAR